MTSSQGKINVDETSWRCIDVDMTLFLHDVPGRWRSLNIIYSYLKIKNMPKCSLLETGKVAHVLIILFKGRSSRCFIQGEIHIDPSSGRWTAPHGSVQLWLQRAGWHNGLYCGLNRRWHRRKLDDGFQSAILRVEIRTKRKQSYRKGATTLEDICCAVV